MQNHKDTASSGLNVNHSSIHKVSDENNVASYIINLFVFWSVIYL